MGSSEERQLARLLEEAPAPPRLQLTANLGAVASDVNLPPPLVDARDKGGGWMYKAGVSVSSKCLSEEVVHCASEEEALARVTTWLSKILEADSCFFKEGMSCNVNHAFATGAGGGRDFARCRGRMRAHHAAQSDQGLGNHTHYACIYFIFPDNVITDESEPNLAEHLFAQSKELLVVPVGGDYKTSSLVCNVNGGSVNAGKGTCGLYAYVTNGPAAPRGERSVEWNARATGTDARSLGTDAYSLGTDARSMGTDARSLGTDAYS
eukprot:COSAG01_NODE_19947_length_980_cov_1.332577_1_plen_264_part_10